MIYLILNDGQFFEQYSFCFHQIKILVKIDGPLSSLQHNSNIK
ncbi:hypothetical protein pb186bvf_002050 [Paramecium bursaria]